MNCRKKTSLPLALGFCFLLVAPRTQATSLDDLVAGARSGTPAPADKNDILKAAGKAAYGAYTDTLADLYLEEIKVSIVDPDQNGGWPFRSSLIESDYYSRKSLTRELNRRFDEKPDAVLAYASICPALYAGDAARIDRLERYLQANDPFLYKMEQDQIARFWRPFIAAAKERIIVPALLSKILPYIASNGTDREMTALFANPLALSAAGATWPYRSIGVQGSDANHVHGFAVGRGNDSDLVLSERRTDGLYAYRTNHEGKVIAAIVVSQPGNQIKTLAPADAQSGFDSNWDYWCDYIDDAVISAGVNQSH
jgi:hypothetical protein